MEKEKNRLENKKMEEEMKRERRGSTGCIEELWKRKREKMEREESRIGEALKKSNVIGEEHKETKERKGEDEKGKDGLEKGLEEWMKEIGGKFEKMMGEVRDGFREQERKMLEKMEEMRREFKDQMREWGKEREEMKKEMEAVKRRMNEIEQKVEQGKEGRGGAWRGLEIKEKIMRMERSLENNEKEKKRKNIVIKGVEVREGKRREVVEEIINAIGAKVEIREIKRVGEGTEKGRGEMLVVGLGNEEQKWEVIGRKKNLKGRKERISEDFTWRERKIRWKMGEIARREEAKGKKVWLKGNKIRMDGQWWKWDEEREKLVDEKGEIREEEGRKVKGAEEGKEERNREEGTETEREEEVWRMIIWNVAGLGSKDKDFWEGLKRWEIIILLETWTEEKGWGKIKNLLPKGYVWKKQWATRKNRKGRAMGGIVMGIKKEIEEKGEKIEVEEEGIIEGRIRIGKDRWRVIGIYMNGDIERYMKKIEEWSEDKREGVRTIIGGDFNARTGNEGGARRDGDEIKSGRGKSRNSKDNKINREGRKLIETIEENGWSIFNGQIEGDEEGEFTYTGGKGCTVIDYIIGDEEVRGKVKKLRVGDRVDSDHHPLEVWIEGKGRKRRGEGRRTVQMTWDTERKNRFKEKIEAEIGNREEEGREIEWEEMEKKIKKVIKECEGESNKGKGESRGWWDEDCRNKKKEVRKELRKWRENRTEIEEYRKKKREYKVLCEKKKKEENEKWEREAEQAKKESDVWRIVNRGRRKRRGIEEGIEGKEWKEHFMRLLGGVEGRIREGGERERGMGEEKEICLGEIEEAISKLKERKAAGTDGVPGEVWKYGGERLTRWAWEYCDKVWRGEGWPEEWKEGLIAPIVKKGEGKRVEDYRGVTLMPMLYKIYMMVLAGRVEKEFEEKEVIPQNQTGFRKRMGTMDNIYVLNYIINKQLGGGKKMVALFIDLKAAFDSVDRKKIYEALEARGVREGLIERIKEVLRETKSRVKIGEEIGESFWTARGVRQGCPISPMLFNAVIADLEEEMRKVRWGGVKIGEKRLYTLAYADDIVLLAEDEEGMRSMIGRLEEYMERKNLEVNAGKTKVMRFRKGGGRWGKREWRWRGKIIEEVKEFTYLGYRLQRNGGQEAQIRERGKRAMAVMKEVWGIGMRRFRKDWGKRLWLFDRLIWTVMSYGVEIWGWKEREKLEKIEERYLKWIFGVDRRTPGYLIREELKRGKLRKRAGERAWGFEKRLEEGKGSEWTRLCWMEVRKRSEKGKTGSEWEEERRRFFEEREEDLKEVERKRAEGRMEFEEISRKDRERQKEERSRKIEESRYNKWYGRIKVEGIPEYLKKGKMENSWKRIMRFRLGNEIRGNEYWMDEEKKRCRLCGVEEETWEHVWEVCREWERGGRCWQERVDEILGEKGEGEWWMREVEKEREENEYRGEEKGGSQREERTRDREGEEERVYENGQSVRGEGNKKENKEVLNEKESKRKRKSQETERDVCVRRQEDRRSDIVANPDVD